MASIRATIQHLLTTLLMAVAVLMWVLTCGGSVATALDIDFDFHDDSAHGNSLEGVDRLGAGHDIGDCAHCHDTFDDSICGVKPLMLFKVDNPDSQTNNLCFECHKSDGTAQQVINEDYGATFGGGTPMFTSIYDAFNPTGTYASSHGLATVKSWVRNRGTWEPDTWITDDTNACLMCHDPHFSQKNFPVEASGYGGVKTAIRRADKVKKLGSGQDDTHMLWGDESVAAGNVKEILSERWTSYDYQAPLRGDSGYEPGPEDSSVHDGSNLVDFVWFCGYQCHRKSSVPGVQQVNWSVATDTAWGGTPSAHGKLAGNGGGFGVLKPPYGNGYDSDDRLARGFMLSCTDCHEPHGSTNHALLRTTVNGVSGLSSGGPGSGPNSRWTYFCEACHEIYPQDPGDPSQQHPVIWPGARCGDYVGCHMRSDGSGGNHGYWF